VVLVTVTATMRVSVCAGVHDGEWRRLYACMCLGVSGCVCAKELGGWLTMGYVCTCNVMFVGRVCVCVCMVDSSVGDGRWVVGCAMHVCE